MQITVCVADLVKLKLMVIRFGNQLSLCTQSKTDRAGQTALTETHSIRLTLIFLHHNTLMGFDFKQSYQRCFMSWHKIQFACTFVTPNLPEYSMKKIKS